MKYNNKHTSNPLNFGMSMVAGLGVIVMIVALAVGVVSGDSANTGLIGVTFAAGLLMLISGVAAWLAVVRPFERFDDINVPKYTGHHDHHDAHEDHSHNAIVSADDQHHPAGSAH